MTRREQTDVAVIGAGPAGAVAAALLRRHGYHVCIIERSHFPRFTVGESLLPQCMDLLDTAGLLAPLTAAGFQVKRGVMFAQGARCGRFDFADQHTPGWDRTWNVRRAEFDHILAQEAARHGARVCFGTQVETIDFNRPGVPRLEVSRDNGECMTLMARFVCDASGFARVLPKMLGLERPVDAPPRAALFTHVNTVDLSDPVTAPGYTREQILVTIHPEQPDVWYWLIPLADGRASVGVVGPPAFIEQGPENPLRRLQARFIEEPHLSRLLAHAVYEHPVRSARFSAAAVSALYGRDYALLGNSGGFTDPIFSSGVTLALKSAVLAAGAIDRQLRGQEPAWEAAFAAPLRQGTRVFASFVDAWYDGRLKHVLFQADPDPDVRRMIASLLAGYVWDTSNPYAIKTARRLRTLCDICAA